MYRIRDLDRQLLWWAAMSVLSSIDLAGEPFTAESRDTDTPIRCVTRENLKTWLEDQPPLVRNWLTSIKFNGDSGRIALVPDAEGNVASIVLGIEDRATPWSFARLIAKLPKGNYTLVDIDEDTANIAALGWALGSYRFQRYREARRTLPKLVWPDACEREHVMRIAAAINFGRDLINTSAEDMNPAALAEATAALGQHHDADVSIIEGDDLLEHGYPAIHAVGRAADYGPRLIDLSWGDPDAPKLTLVGKGVCFDSGGLDLKPASNMRLMKKDMGGAASVLALAHMVMDVQLPVRLRVLIPAVENAVAGNAMRPGDILQTRKGITVEVGNTDAEGRLILSDALTEAASESPDLLIDVATLTGAARYALGTDLPALFCNDDAICHAFLEHGERSQDPMWRMPLYAPYRRLLNSSIADIQNIASSGYGGAITAALFLREFTEGAPRWVHIDTMAWNTSARPGRPVGGEIIGMRGLFEALQARYQTE